MSVGSVGGEVLAERTPRRSLGTAAARNPASTTECEPSLARTVLKVPTRVADPCNHPMNRTGHQLRPTAEALRERREHEPVDNRRFGLLADCDHGQRIQPHDGVPAPTTSTNRSPAAGTPSSSSPARGPSPPSAASSTGAARCPRPST